jgi:hypothetical protein
MGGCKYLSDASLEAVAQVRVRVRVRIKFG